ncbi:DUF1097 domain-containing protein [Geodermatophilus sp. SYSU D00758]
MSGVIWGWAIVRAATQLGGSAAVLGLAVAVAAFAMCVQATWSLLAFTPGTFVGAAGYFGNRTVFWSTVVSLLLGAVLALASERPADVVERLLGAPRPAERPAPAAAAHRCR